MKNWEKIGLLGVFLTSVMGCFGGADTMEQGSVTPENEESCISSSSSDLTVNYENGVVSYTKKSESCDMPWGITETSYWSVPAYNRNIPAHRRTLKELAESILKALDDDTLKDHINEITPQIWI